MRIKYISRSRAKEKFDNGERVGWSNPRTGEQWITDNDKNVDDFEKIDLMITGGEVYFNYFVEIEL